MKSFATIFAVFLGLAFGDLYMHNPRGSNNRLNEASANTANNNRLFDSQNNNKGGYCWGQPLYYYEGSILSIEWTNQHSCGNENADCQMVIQYMCGSANDEPGTVIRDGKTTDRIPDDGDMNSATYFDIMSDTGGYEYGMHESYAYYQKCKTRSRNYGLYIADREDNIGGGQRDARFTRQNNNANRRGFECPEERDYYPYWAPTKWVDIAILTTNHQDLCPWYKAESENVKSRYECQSSDDPTKIMMYIDGQQCAANGGKWVEVAAHGVSKPHCGPSPWARDNHLGNGFNGHANTYNWTLPRGGDLDCLSDDSCVCVLRLRYNISTWDTDNFDKNGDNPWDNNGQFADSTLNGEASPIKQDPLVPVAGVNMSLALNTNQYGRTFQDRSAVFSIKSREFQYATAAIYNLNVRGKRGNIVQAYPAVEYDFAPTFLHIPEGAFIHFQWTGCDTNPQGNAGEGTEQTDRSNLVQIASQNSNVPATEEEIESWPRESRLFPDAETRQMFALAGQNWEDCPTYAQLMAENNNDENEVEEAVNNCFKLNAAPQRFDGGLHKPGGGALTLGKTYHYMSTRNNNFTNRSHKAAITIITAIPGWSIGVIIGAGLVVAAGSVVGAGMYMAKVKPHSWLGSKFAGRV